MSGVVYKMVPRVIDNETKQTPTGGPQTPTGGPQTPTGGPQTQSGQNGDPNSMNGQTPTGGPQTPTGEKQTPMGEPQTPTGGPQSGGPLTDGTQIGGPQNQVNVTQISEEHKRIMEKEQEIINNIKGQVANPTTGEEPDEESVVGKAIALYMVFVKTYFAIMLKVGDYGAKTLIQMFLPSDVSEQILSDNPDISKIVKTFTQMINVLERPEFRNNLSMFVGKLKQTIEPQMMKLLNSAMKIFIEVAEKNASKLILSLVNSVTAAFPPAALVVDVAALMSSGLHAATSGLNLFGVSTDGLVNMKKSAMSSVDEFTQMLDSMTNFSDGPTIKTEPSQSDTLNVVTTNAKQPVAKPQVGGVYLKSLQKKYSKGQSKILTKRIQKSIHQYKQTNRIKKTNKTKKHTRK